jgi:FkbM family methyltransferase
MTVVDIGANIGYYTVIAAGKVGATGHVYAFEPEKENFNFLQKSVIDNKFGQVSACQMGISDKTGAEQLFLSTSNKGDHRMYSVEGRSGVVIQVTTLDDFCKQQSIEKIDVIKMDIQGAEGLALDGMKETLRNNKHIKMFTEFWPEGLRTTGHDPLIFLRTLQEYGFVIFEIKENEQMLVKQEDLAQLVARHTGRKYANLLCEKYG